MSETIITDCLVLKIEENNDNKTRINKRIYIFYDTQMSNYVIRGQNVVNEEWNQFSNYSFVSENMYSLADFIQYIICKDKTVNIVLYNYTNFVEDSNDITVDFLKENETHESALVRYDYILSVNRNKLITNLRILQNVFNYYN